MVINMRGKAYISLFLFAILLVAIFMPLHIVNADSGPKPSTKIYIENMPESHYICTLLTDHPFPYKGYQAPNIPYYETVNDIESYGFDEDSVFYDFVANVNKLVDRLNAENFDYQFDFQVSNGDDELTTTVNYLHAYYAPDRFIAIVYDLDNDILYYTNNIQKTVFSAQYSANYEDGFVEVNSNTYQFSPTLTVIRETSPRANWTEQYGLDPAVETVWFNVLMFIARIIFTVVIELLIALCFKFTKKSYGIIAITNVATQVFLNAIIWISMYFGGPYWGGLEGFFVGEIVVFTIEPIVYYKTCERINGSKKSIIWYGLLANFVTFALSVGISLIEAFA